MFVLDMSVSGASGPKSMNTGNSMGEAGDPKPAGTPDSTTAAKDVGKMRSKEGGSPIADA